jgi:hypothetical protein
MDAMLETLATLSGQITALTAAVRLLIEMHPQRDELMSMLSNCNTSIEQMVATARADVMMSDETAEPVTPALIKQKEAALVTFRILTSK